MTEYENDLKNKDDLIETLRNEKAELLKQISNLESSTEP